VSLDQITEWARIDWPASSRNIQYYSESGIDSIALLRFDIAPDELQRLIGSLGFTKPLRASYRPFPPEVEAPKWWVDRDIDNAVGGTVMIPGLCREIYIDQSRPDSYTVYLRTFEV